MSKPRFPKPVPAEPREDGVWYHENNVAGLMLMCLFVGFTMGCVIAYFFLPETHSMVQQATAPDLTLP